MSLAQRIKLYNAIDGTITGAANPGANYSRPAKFFRSRGDIEGVQTLFAVSDEHRLLGVAVFVRLALERFVVLHLGVQHPYWLAPAPNTRVLLKLMHEIRGAARRTHGVDRIELVYKDRHAVRLHL